MFAARKHNCLLAAVVAAPTGVAAVTASPGIAVDAVVAASPGIAVDAVDAALSEIAVAAKPSKFHFALRFVGCAAEIMVG